MYIVWIIPTIMLFKTTKQTIVWLPLFIGLMTLSTLSNGQRNPPIFQHNNVVCLEQNDSKAKAMVAKNLNRYALDKLYDYDVTLDSAFRSELKDSLSLMELNYLKNSKAVQQNLKNQQETITTLTSQENEIKTKYDKLKRIAILSIASWLFLTLLFLQFKRRRVNKHSQELQKTTSRLKSVKENSLTATHTLNKFKQNHTTFLKLKDDADHLLSVVGTIENEFQNKDGWNTETTLKVQKMTSSIHFENRIINAFNSQEDDFGLENETTDINKICEEYVEIVLRGIKEREPEYTISITKDFEKNLPQLKVNQPALGNLLLNVMDNAFLSVIEKSKSGIKGYQPKISISTRILPRFLQIRIKDNGMGMTDVILENAFTEFYSTRQNEAGSGLGLSESKNNISVLNKGEIKIESEKRNSTDVYIKLFI